MPREKAPARRLIGFLRERFPPAAYGPAIGAYVVGVYGLTGWARAAPAGVDARLAIVLAAVTLAFVCLRCADDLKDAASDRVEHPERPLPRGLVSAGEVRGLLAACAAGGVGCAASLGGAPLAAYAVWLGFLALTGKEFFAGASLRRRPALYALTHSPLVPLLTAFVWVAHPAPGGTAESLAGLMGVTWAIGLAAEAGRKARRRGRAVDADGGGAGDEVRVWDNANIVESFPGITTPLTFSVAREAYAVVYPQACRALGVSERTLAAHAAVFEQMIGHHRGRVYYNLNSWHRVVALLPGFRHNQEFLERMMGAARPSRTVGSRRSGGCDADATEARPSRTVGSRRSGGAARALDTMRLVGILVRRWVAFGRDAARFQAGIDRVMAEHRRIDYAALSADELIERYETLRRRVLHAWHAPIVNDFLLMVFHGALRRCAERWLGDAAHATANALLTGRTDTPAPEALRRSSGPAGELPSTAPGRELVAIAGRVRIEPAWRAALRAGSEDLARRLEDDAALVGLRRLIEGYLDRWGDRCPEELQLDRPTYRDDPRPLFRSLAELAEDGAPAWPPTTDGRPARGDGAPGSRSPAALAGLGGGRRWVLVALARRARRHIWWREQMRFARGQVFGIARCVFAALGERLAAAGGLERAEDVHYLDVHCLRGLVRGTACSVSGNELRALVRWRRAAFEEYRVGAPPPRRFETAGPVFVSRPEEEPPADDGQPAETPGRGRERLRGTGASAGRVRAPAVVVHDPRRAGSVAGKVVVALSTDPGWLPIFISAAGLVVERGGLLSHSAIVARELGLPAVVGLRDATRRVRTGQRVELDGASGDVWLVPA